MGPQALSLCAAVLLIPSARADDQQAAYATVWLGVPSAEAGVPAVFSVDLSELAGGLGLEEVRAEDLRVGVETDGGVRPVRWQLSRGADESAVSVCVLPPSGVAALRLRLSVGGSPELAPVAGAQPAVTVEREGGRVTIRNAHYAVTHEKGVQAGLPSTIVFRGTGKTFTGYSLNDRLWKQGSAYYPRNDADAEMEVLAEGPLCASVRVRARYVSADGPAKTGARATYTFHYFADSPFILAECRVQQDEAFPWDELHFLEINFPDESFTMWATASRPAPAPLAADGSSHDATGWAAVTDRPDTLGLAYPGRVIIHDGRGAYGTYIHGPWVTWDSKEIAFRAYLYASAGPGALGRISGLAAGLGVSAQPRITTTLVESLTSRLMLYSDSQSAWAGALAARSCAEGRVSEAVKRLEAVVAASSGGRVAAALGLPPEQVRALGEDRLHAAVVVRPAGGASLASLFDWHAGRELLSAEQPLWRARARDAEGHTVDFDSVTLARVAAPGGDYRGVTLSWEGPAEGPLQGTTAEQSIAVNRARLTSQLRVNAGPGLALLEVTPLTLSLGPLGDDQSDDYLLSPMVSGQLLRDPIAKGIAYSGDYPSGWCSLAMGAYYDAKGGLYAACHDPKADTKFLGFTSQSQAVSITTRYPVPDSGVAGNRFEQPGETVCELFTGDWFDAGAIYRAWVEREAPWWPDAARPDTPEWMKHVAIWAQTGGAPSEVVPRVKAMAQFMGVPIALHWYSWHEIPFDVNYPHYFPAKPGFAEGVHELQAAGVRVMPYINGRLWDTALDDFKSTGIAAATKGEDGKPYIEEYGSGAKLAPMCPTQALWRDTVRGIVLRLCGPEVGVDGVYIDQIAAAGPRLCFDKSHGHPLSGGHWWTEGGYWPLLTQLRKELHELSPEKMITTECNAEPYAHLMDGYLTWHFQYADQVPLFASIYGGRVQLFGRAYNGDDVAVRMKAAQSLVWGEQIGWVDPSIIERPGAGPYLRRAARLRHALQPFLAVGRMEQPPTLRGTIPDVTADWQWSGPSIRTYPAVQSGAWKANDGRVAVIFANIKDEPVDFVWVPGADATGVTRVTEDGQAPLGEDLHADGLPIHLEGQGIVAYILPAG
jgi:hypothetical protein